jgi:hypothetical protein
MWRTGIGYIAKTAVSADKCGIAARAELGACGRRHEVGRWCQIARPEVAHRPRLVARGVYCNLEIGLSEVDPAVRLSRGRPAAATDQDRQDYAHTSNRTAARHASANHRG